MINFIYSEKGAFKIKMFLENLPKTLSENKTVFVVKYKLDEDLVAINKIIEEQTVLPKECFYIKKENEFDFKEYFIAILSGIQEELVCFLTTDCIFIDEFDKNKIEKTFMNEPALFSFSLKLGKNIVKNTKVGAKNILIPTEEKDGVVLYDWSKHYVDFGDPFNLHGNVLRRKEILKFSRNLKFNDIFTLEDEMGVFMNFPKNIAACFEDSKMFLIDVKYHTDIFHLFRELLDKRIVTGTF